MAARNTAQRPRSAPPRLSLAVAGPSPFEAALDAALDAVEDAADEDAATEPVVVGSPLSPRSGCTFGPQIDHLDLGIRQLLHAVVPMRHDLRRSRRRGGENSRKSTGGRKQIVFIIVGVSPLGRRALWGCRRGVLCHASGAPSCPTPPETCDRASVRAPIARRFSTRREVSSLTTLVAMERRRLH